MSDVSKPVDIAARAMQELSERPGRTLPPWSVITEAAFSALERDGYVTLHQDRLRALLTSLASTALTAEMADRQCERIIAALLAEPANAAAPPPEGK